MQKKQVVSVWNYMIALSPFIFFWALVFCPTTPVEFIGMKAALSSFVIWFAILLFFVGLGFGIMATIVARKFALDQAKQQALQEAVPS